ncbi:protoheme IX synthesis protein [Alcaligenaceae bacterium SJ-26]|nr:protoheme IX synthesis protein [Alcaligenaceae bacterium SJ-26]
MRAWFWTLLLAVVAVAAAVLLRQHAGNVVILVPPYRIELSIMLAVALIVGSFILLYVGLRFLSWLLSVPGRWRGWRGRRAQHRDDNRLERGWIGLLAGRYAQSEKDLTKLLGQTRNHNRKVLAALSAARAAHAQAAYTRRDELLRQAQEFAGEKALVDAVGALWAELLLEQGQPQAALEKLQTLPYEEGARYVNITRLLLRAHVDLAHHEQAYLLARALFKRKALEPAEAERIIGVAAAGRLLEAGDDWRTVWKSLKSTERTLPPVALAAARLFDAQEQGSEASKVLESALDVQLDPELLAAYARCAPADVQRRLSKAVRWLKDHPDHPDLLRAMGVLCLHGQIWGQAERYLRRSLAVQPTAGTYALLGSLSDRLGRRDDALSYLRQATAASVGLPDLAASAALPAADVQADPHHLVADNPEDFVLPDPQTADSPDILHQRDGISDYDVHGGVLPSRHEAVVASSDRDDAFHEYFDSAPIPAASLGTEEPAASSEAARTDSDKPAAY